VIFSAKHCLRETALFLPSFALAGAGAQTAVPSLHGRLARDLPVAIRSGLFLAQRSHGLSGVVFALVGYLTVIG